MNVTHLDYHLSINTWLTFVTRMPTAPTRKGHTTAVARRVMQEMETNVTVRYKLTIFPLEWNNCFIILTIKELCELMKTIFYVERSNFG